MLSSKLGVETKFMCDSSTATAAMRQGAITTGVVCATKSNVQIMPRCSITAFFTHVVRPRRNRVRVVVPDDRLDHHLCGLVRMIFSYGCDDLVSFSNPAPADDGQQNNGKGYKQMSLHEEARAHSSRQCVYRKSDTSVSHRLRRFVSRRLTGATIRNALLAVRGLDRHHVLCLSVIFLSSLVLQPTFIRVMTSEYPRNRVFLVMQTTTICCFGLSFGALIPECVDRQCEFPVAG
jgi:hypothetical protein